MTLTNEQIADQAIMNVAATNPKTTLGYPRNIAIEAARLAREEAAKTVANRSCNIGEWELRQKIAAAIRVGGNPHVD